ncbi:succinate dehydrogenase cytochrome b subunit [Aliifodinibius sp. S!AR15-10]|uniref:succinate dehydrogenase cytochrome b subunit n=1 Tax=Aliifodinibius sp. S!AR15-10 TaxID=2950437 RepID=UPI0028661973|nr:succinate dehydrogenase cytochrome b subunit [Aliifodinibius sp. S!AR15-10]MDR8391741.1 succinate dehydrogenase cytochrome b subunit [Aliifodinibius sp. S!AR15-10]
MPSFLQAFESQVGRKILTGVTGVGLILFIIGHLAGNLTLFGDAQAFNEYTLGLESLGWILYIIEAVLVVGFLLHAYLGVSIWLKRRKSRPEGYKDYSSKGGASHVSWASRSMIFTGIVLFVFVVIHLDTFKFGATETVMIDGEAARDLKSLVIEKFQSPLYAFGYTFVMILLGFHLKHGFWSAFTSLTMKHNKFSGIIYTVGIIFAILMAVGFIFIPLYIYFTGGTGALLTP